MSLKVMLKKFAHKGQITQEEYDALIKKLDGHDREIRVQARAEALDEFAEKLKAYIEKDLANPDLMLDCKKCAIWKAKEIDKIAEQLKEE